MANSPTAQHKLEKLQQQVIQCRRCPRLVEYREKVAREKRRMFRDWDYWGKPVPSFGDPKAELLIVGLAPAAHGANRTGRMFTGDRSGDFLFRALYDAGFASQPDSRHRDDGLQLRRCYITAALRCAPPVNKPLPQELKNCQPYLESELEFLCRIRAVLALGKIAFDRYLSVMGEKVDLPARSKMPFGHGVSYELPGGLPRLFASYHPSQQNTQTGKLTLAMMHLVLAGIDKYLQSSR
ncbi:MAG TPA: uracil-DNA glycosylase [Terriglobia bacterium]|nr:uracil-DNA glycosylase [Terriglobia bacterium]